MNFFLHSKIILYHTWLLIYSALHFGFVTICVYLHYHICIVFNDTIFLHNAKHIGLKSPYRSLLLNNFHGGRIHRKMHSTD